MFETDGDGARRITLTAVTSMKPSHSSYQNLHIKLTIWLQFCTGEPRNVFEPSRPVSLNLDILVKNWIKEATVIFFG